MASSNETLEVKIDAIKELLLDHVREGRDSEEKRDKIQESNYKRFARHDKLINRALGAMSILVFFSGGAYAFASYFVKDEIKGQTTELKKEILSSREMNNLLDEACDDCLLKIK